MIYDLDKVKIENLAQRGCGLPVSNILKEEQAPMIMRNTCIIGGFCKVVGIEWDCS